jgi:CheY-like chemotaxis protein
LSWAESEPGKGTTFYFTIIAEAVSSVSKVYLRAQKDHLKNKKILIVDDNTTNIKILKTYAESWGMISKVSDNPAHALKWLMTGERFDIALIDYNMPGMDGIKLTSNIKKIEHCRDLPVIILSSFGRKDIPESERDNINAIINKPIKHSQLYECLLQNIKKETEHKKADAELAHADEPVKPGESHPINILLAEDNPVNQKVALRFLERIGYKADVANNGIEVLDVLKNKRYDLILMDLLMPELDGYETTKIIRKDFPQNEQPVIIAMTANNLHESENDFINASMDGFITKPIGIKEFYNLFAEWGKKIHNNKQAEKDSAELVNFDKITSMHGISSEEDANFLAELIDTFSKDMPSVIQEIADAVEKQDCKKVKFYAHKLKGSSVTLGITAISDMTKNIEKSVSGNKVTEETRMLTLELINSSDVIIRELNRFKEKLIRA